MDLREVWETHATEWIEWARAAGHDSYWTFHRDQFLQIVPPPGRRTIDIGCGEGRLFQGFLSVAPRCGTCGLDYSFADAGDGPAVFVILIIGFVVVGLALWMEVTLAPPLWVHFMLWVPLILVLGLTALRLIKGVLITLQYRNKAAEGRL
ncbi:MAG: DUF983 domain-containing protein, partial [Mesorhizobium sp.]|nr:DUF983 domain-containing protein [Mesorhizobium sp.]